MKKNIVFIMILLIGSITFAQEGNKKEIEDENITTQKSPQFTKKREPAGKEKKQKPPISDYKIIDIHNNITFVDTTLTIQKDYNFNYLRRDDFGLQQNNF